MRRLVLSVIVVGVSTLVWSAVVNYDHSLPLLRQETGVSNTGVNNICLPYLLDSTLSTASDLMEDIEASAGQGEVTSISKYSRSSGGLATYAGTILDYDTDFYLEAGQGLLVQVDNIDASGNNDFEYEITGSYDEDDTNNLAEINFYAQGETLPETGTSAEGVTDYCPAYNATAVTQKASDLRDQINAITADSVVDIQRFLRVSDTLESYSGNDFTIEAGQSYRITVSSQTDPYVPDQYNMDVDVEIVELPPGCAGQDSGRLSVTSHDPHGEVRLSWRGGSGYYNLVFVPTTNGTVCCDEEPWTCDVGGGDWKAATCPGPGANGIGCEHISNYAICGCEISDMLRGTCIGSNTRCLVDADCGAGGECGEHDRLILASAGDPSGDDEFVSQCANVGCGTGYENNCDNKNIFGGGCEDVDTTWCDAIQPNYTFDIDGVSVDGGATFINPETSGVVVSGVDVEVIACCSLWTCSNATTTPCDDHGDCPGGSCSVLPAACQGSF